LSRRDFEPRAHQRQTERTLLLVGFGVMLLLVGGLAWWQLGTAPAVCGLVSVGAGALLLGGLWLLMTLIERCVGTE